MKLIRRGQAAGKEPGGDEEVTEELLLEDNRAVQVQNKELTVDDIVNMIQFGKPFTVGEDIPAKLPPGDPNFPKYKDIPNSVVDKEDKKANKAKARAERDILIPTQTQEGIASGAGKVVGGLVGGALGLGVNRAAGLAVGGGIMKAGAALQRKIDKRRENLKKETYDTWFEASEWAKSKEDERKESDRLLKIHKEREARYQKQQRKKREANVPAHPDAALTKQRRGEEAELAIMSLDHKEPHRKLKITQKGLDALRKDRDRRATEPKLSITAKGMAALEKDKKNQNKDPVGKQHEGTDTWHPDPKKDKVTKHQARRLPSSPKIPIKKSRKSNVDFQDLRPQFKEVAPPGWGHTKAEKEKTKPNKPKSKIGGSAHEFDKDLKSGKFKGLPGDTTMKDKKASMFKLMWSMKNKGDKPHYKPGVKDKLKAKYKKDESVLDSAKRYLDNG